MTTKGVGALSVSALTGEMVARVAADFADGNDVPRGATRRRPEWVDVAHTRLVWCDANTTMGEVAEETSEGYVLVEDDGTAVGIVSARDLLGACAAAEAADNADDG